MISEEQFPLKKILTDVKKIIDPYLGCKTVGLDSAAAVTKV